MSKKKTRAELETELRLLRKTRSINQWTSVLNNLITWGGCCGIAYCLYLTVSSLSGKTTDADIGLNLIGSIELSDVFMYLFSGGGLWYGLSQRSLRRQTVERLQDRIRVLERAVDERRTSSGLTPQGVTHPEDK